MVKGANTNTKRKKELTVPTETTFDLPKRMVDAIDLLNAKKKIESNRFYINADILAGMEIKLRQLKGIMEQSYITKNDAIKGMSNIVNDYATIMGYSPDEYFIDYDFETHVVEIKGKKEEKI